MPRPRCTVCGVKVVEAGGVLYHVENGASSPWSGRPVDHHATMNPVFLVLWLRWR